MRRPDTRDPSYPRVSDEEALERLREYQRTARDITHPASCLADVIWPGRKWRSQQGAAGAATRVLKRLGATQTGRNLFWRTP